jgi:ElaB/YqjD/DUF883 family membrane-anchored ribosome-binding protein
MTASNTMSTTNPASAVSGIADRAHQAVDKAAEKAMPALERASSAAHRTVDKVADLAAPAAEWATESGKQLAAKSGELTEVCSSYVRARPLVAIAGAVAIGYLIGRITR